MDVATVETQKTDAMGVLTSQFGVQEKMLDHQHDAQLNMLKAEKDRAIAQMETQYKQQTSQLSMAKMQREMSIQQQAAQMTAQAKQYEMQVEMQKQVGCANGRLNKVGNGTVLGAPD